MEQICLYCSENAINETGASLMKRVSHERYRCATDGTVTSWKTRLRHRRNKYGVNDTVTPLIKQKRHERHGYAIDETETSWKRKIRHWWNESAMKDTGAPRKKRTRHERHRCAVVETETSWRAQPHHVWNRIIVYDMKTSWRMYQLHWRNQSITLNRWWHRPWRDVKNWFAGTNFLQQYFACHLENVDVIHGEELIISSERATSSMTRS